MLTLPPSVRVWACAQPVDMRKQFDGLAAVAEHVMRLDPLSGHLFAFFNRRGNMAKCLFWDRTATCGLWSATSTAGVTWFRTTTRLIGMASTPKPRL